MMAWLTGMVLHALGGRECDCDVGGLIVCIQANLLWQTLMLGRPNVVDERP